MASAKRLNPDTEICELRLTGQETAVLLALLGRHILGPDIDPDIHPRYHTNKIFEALHMFARSDHLERLVTRGQALYLEAQKVPCV